MVHFQAHIVIICINEGMQLNFLSRPPPPPPPPPPPRKSYLIHTLALRDHIHLSLCTAHVIGGGSIVFGITYKYTINSDHHQGLEFDLATRYSNSIRLKVIKFVASDRSVVFNGYIPVNKTDHPIIAYTTYMLW